MFVLAEQQRLQRFRQVGIVERAQEGASQARGADRICAWRRAKRLGEGFEAQVQHFERRLIAADDRFAEPLSGQVESELALADQAQRQAGTGQLPATKEIVEVGRDPFAIAHQQAGAALAHAEQVDQVLAWAFAVGPLQHVLQLVLDGTVQPARNRAELLDGDAFEFAKQSRRVRTGCVCRAERLNGQGTPRVSAGAPDRYEARA